MEKPDGIRKGPEGEENVRTPGVESLSSSDLIPPILCKGGSVEIAKRQTSALESSVVCGENLSLIYRQPTLKMESPPCSIAASRLKQPASFPEESSASSALADGSSRLSVKLTLLPQGKHHFASASETFRVFAGSCVCWRGADEGCTARPEGLGREPKWCHFPSPR